jgi:cell division protein FtsB
MLRFSIREILLLTVVVALGFGWWLHLRRVQVDVEKMQQRLAEQEKEIKKQQLLGRFLKAQVEQLDKESRKVRILPLHAILKWNEA